YCKSCGAEVIAANEEASLTCPYCTNKIVLSNKVSGKFRPDGIIPFKIPQSELKKHLDDFYKDKKLLPRNFFSQSKMEKVTGIYVPFWLFSGTVGGDFVYNGDKVKTSVSGDYNVTETSTYNVQRSGQVTFENIPLDASEKIDDALMDSVLPYDFSEVKNFNYQYLAGFAADRFDVPGKSLQKRAEDRMINTTAKKATSSVRSEYSNVSMKNNYLKAVNVKVKYILLPVYLFSIKHDGTKYEFSVNGQTGKVVGNLPIDKKVCIWYRLKKSLIPAAVVALYFILSYFLG
nr:PepSY domain-containing protein [Lachnospiraceae bacterium]